MALDFAILTKDETSADIVPLEWDQHEALIDLAKRFKLTQLLRFEDYFEEVDLTPAQLPELSEELEVVKNYTVLPDIAKFVHDLKLLIAVAIKRNKKLSAAPD